MPRTLSSGLTGAEEPSNNAQAPFAAVRTEARLSVYLSISERLSERTYEVLPSGRQ